MTSVKSQTDLDISRSSHASSIALMRRMLRFLRPVWKTATIACLVIVARSLAEVSSVYFLSPAITTLATKLNGGASEGNAIVWIMGTSPSACELRIVLLFMALSQIILGVMIYLRSVWDTKLSMRAVFFIRSAVYDRLQRVDLKFHEKMSSATLINRATNDLQAVRHFVNLSLLSSLDIVVSLGLYLGLLLSRSPKLMCVALVPLPFWCFVIFRFSRKAQPLCQSSQEANDHLTSVLSENLTGAQVVRAFGAEQQEREKYRRQNDNFVTALLKIVSLQATLTPMLKLIATGAHIGLFAYSANLVNQGTLKVGDLLLLGATMAAILAKLQQINAIVEAYQKAIVSSRRLFEILDLKDALDSPATNLYQGFSLSHGDIEFCDVKLEMGGKTILSSINAKIPGGQVTALIGPTGSGKSMLAGLIARFHHPSNGSIFIDGQNLRDVELRALREKIGFVFQETFLFTSSVRDNIRYGRTDVSDEMVEAAAHTAMASDFISRLPQGYETMIGDRGISLSGGQRQRLALARALVFNPSILILDDATAALDSTTEMIIFRRLEKALRGRTVLVIASRLISVQSADHILVVEDGRITQSGKPEELAQSAGHYQEMIAIQNAMNEEFSIKLGSG